MKKMIYVYLMLLPLNIIAQNTDSIIRQIRSEYKTIVDNKEKYETVTIDVPPEDLYPFFDDEADDEPFVEQNITYYFNGNEIKFIIVSSEETFPWYRDLEQIEYYLKNNHVFFMYQYYIKKSFLFGYQWETERRIYYDSNQAVKCLVKEVEGESEIDSLLQKTANKEEDCSKMSDIGSSLIGIYYTKNIDSLFEYYRKHGKK